MEGFVWKTGGRGNLGLTRCVTISLTVASVGLWRAMSSRNRGIALVGGECSMKAAIRGMALRIFWRKKAGWERK